jgi:CRISPR-associated protein Cmr3
MTFNYLILIHPLGFMYGSAGGFLSPENLVGRSGQKFPPDAATLSGLFFAANRVQEFTTHEKLRNELYVAGPFWAESDAPDDFYVPIPWTKIIADDGTDEWRIENHKWQRDENKKELEPGYKWQNINYWNDSASNLRSNQAVKKTPWHFVSMLHPRIQDEERCVREGENGSLFLENAVQMDDDTCLVYLSSHQLPDGWYRFGGENHLVEITCLEIPKSSFLYDILRQDIKKSFALITPGVWGSNQLSYRYPKHPDFPTKRPMMLTDRPVPYRYRLGEKYPENEPENQHKETHHHSGRISRGRYAVPPGTVYIFHHSIDKPWSEWSEEYFPKEGFSLKQLGCNLCLPLDIAGVE